MKRKGNLPLFILPPDFLEYVFMPRFRSRINTSAFLSATRLPTPPPLFVSITPGAVTFPFVRKCSFYRRLPHYTVSSYPGKIAPTAALTNKKKRKKELTFSVFFSAEKSYLFSLYIAAKSAPARFSPLPDIMSYDAPCFSVSSLRYFSNFCL